MFGPFIHDLLIYKIKHSIDYIHVEKTKLYASFLFAQTKGRKDDFNSQQTSDLHELK